MKKIYIVIIIIGKNKKEEKMKNNKIKKLIKLRGKAKTWVGTVISFIKEGIIFYFFYIYLIEL